MPDIVVQIHSPMLNRALESDRHERRRPPGSGPDGEDAHRAACVDTGFARTALDAAVVRRSSLGHVYLERNTGKTGREDKWRRAL